ncbi:MAG: ribbon-helix-helix domain-containing protein, partial [Methylocella sp.]
MTITLTPEQEARLKAYVAHGEYASIEEAARQLIDERIAERATEEGDDLAWAKPCVDEALA